MHHSADHAHNLPPLSVLTLLHSFQNLTVRIPIMVLRGRMELFLKSAFDYGGVPLFFILFVFIQGELSLPHNGGVLIISFVTFSHLQTHANTQ
jgi:hypothetical protein